MFLKLFILSLIFTAIAALGLGIRILLKSGGSFPETHVGHNKEMRKRGIRCAQNNDVGCHSTAAYPGCACTNNRLAD